jgi:hypothetical protein
MATVDVPKTLGALLLGGLFAALYVQAAAILPHTVLTSKTFYSLSGGVTVQVVLYFKLYTTDPFRVKALVRSELLSETHILNLNMYACRSWLFGMITMKAAVVNFTYAA